jgi:hypothetical protein
MPLGNQEQIADWGTHANCYAYAAGWDTPARGNIGGAVPGGASGGPVLGGAPGYHQALVAAAVNDGLTAAAGAPANPPADLAGHYLVALIATATGFHWLRRDRLTRRWSWKNGNAGAVLFNVLHVAQDRYVYITDTNLDDLLTVNRNGYMPWTYSNTQFVSFFHVPNAGVTVAGR